MDISPNSVNMAWQIPQYFLITAGEVVFSVTGLEFSYSQVERALLTCIRLPNQAGNARKAHITTVAQRGKVPLQWTIIGPYIKKIIYGN